MAAPYRGVLFDLFGTLVAFDAGRLPELEVEGVRHRTTVGGLAPALAEWVPGVSLAAFARALLAVSDELARARAVDHLELPSRERFRRALARAGCAPGVLASAAGPAGWVPGVSRAAFAGALLAVSDELARARAVDHIELPSRERFRRALARVGCAPGVLAEAAVDLSRAHMALIAAATVLPPA